MSLRRGDLHAMRKSENVKYRFLPANQNGFDAFAEAVSVRFFRMEFDGEVSSRNGNGKSTSKC